MPFVDTMHELISYREATAVPPPPTPPAPESTSTPVAVADISVLPSLYEHQEYGGIIPHVLLNAPKQQAASIILTEKVKASTTNASISISTQRASVADALVNIFCTMKTKRSIRATSGSGVFIADTGVILTNAHVAQFLLINQNTAGITSSCVVRSGSPAIPKYYADLLYISPLWIKDNAALLQTEHPSGTGERDYALLYVTKAVDGATLPSSFPALPIDVTPFNKTSKNEVVRAGGFPAEIIRTEGPKALLMPTVATTTITELFTYTRDNIDLVGIAPSSVGEQGSSGGPITTLDDTVIGLISTKGNEAKDGAKSLRAITIPYINRTIYDEVHVGLLDTISSKLADRARIFRATVEPLLRDMVLDNIDQQ
jgi:hypothetical protein